jgi:hypothetical protein
MKINAKLRLHIIVARQANNSSTYKIILKYIRYNG